LSTLTKVFTVVLVVFSIAFTTMTISIVAQSTDWRDTALKYEEHARVADTNLRNLIAASAAEIATARDSIKGNLEKIGELEGQVQTVNAEAAKIRSDMAKIESEKSSADAMNRGLLAQLQIAESARAEYRKHRDDVEKRSIELERRNIDLNDRVNELTDRISVLTEQKRQYEQQINILRGENQKISRATGRPTIEMEQPASTSVANVKPLTPMGTKAISGKVTEVEGNLVTISVGSDDGVQKDMEFMVHRSGQYVGKLQVQLVNPNQAAGRMLGLSALAPSRGDEVTDSGAMGAPRGKP